MCRRRRRRHSRILLVDFLSGFFLFCPVHGTQKKTEYPAVAAGRVAVLSSFRLVSAAE